MIEYIADRVLVMYLATSWRRGARPPGGGAKHPLHASRCFASAPSMTVAALAEPDQRRSAEPRQPAVGVSLPHALCARDAAVSEAVPPLIPLAAITTCLLLYS